MLTDLKSLRPLAFAGVFALSLLPAVRAQSIVETWGYNHNGQLGNGSTASGTTPGTVSNLPGGVTAIGAGANQSFAVQNGGVYGWGSNLIGQLGDGTTTDRHTPVAVSGLSSGVASVAGGYFYTLALQNGSVYAWGANDYGQLGNGGTTTQSAVPAAVPTLAVGITAISAGNYHGLAIQNGGAVAWGNNSNGQLGNGTLAQSNVPVPVFGLGTGVNAVSGGGNFSLAIKDGGVFAWGDNGSGQVGNGTSGNRFATPVALTLNTGVTAIAAGGDHSLAVQNGHVYAWGSNDYGQLGNGTLAESDTPIEIDAVDLKNIVAVAASQSSSYALSADGSLWVWGRGDSGQLGLGTTTFIDSTPQHLLPPSGYVYTEITANNNGTHALAILSAVPEPSTWALLSLGTAGLGFVLRRRSTHV